MQGVAIALGTEVSRTHLKAPNDVQSLQKRITDAAVEYQRTISGAGVVIGMADVYCSQIYNGLTTLFQNLVGMVRVQLVNNAPKRWLSKKVLITMGAVAGGIALVSLGTYALVRHRRRHEKGSLSTPESAEEVRKSIVMVDEGYPNGNGGQRIPREQLPPLPNNSPTISPARTPPFLSIEGEEKEDEQPEDSLALSERVEPSVQVADVKRVWMMLPLPVSLFTRTIFFNRPKSPCVGREKVEGSLKGTV